MKTLKYIRVISALTILPNISLTKRLLTLLPIWVQTLMMKPEKHVLGSVFALLTLLQTQSWAAPAPNLSLGADGKIRFTAATNTSYQLFASDNLSSWQPVGGPIDPTNVTVELGVNFNDAPRRFFRVQALPKSSDPSTNGLFRGLKLRDEMEVETRRWIAMGVSNLFLANAYTGTLQQQGQDWVYLPTPTNRLDVAFVSETFSIQWQGFDGDFTRTDAASFLARDHTVVFTVENTSRGLNLLVESYRVGGNELAGISGQFRDKSGLDLTATYGVATMSEGAVAAPGMDYLIRRQYSGTIKGQDFEMTVDEQTRDHFVSATGDPIIENLTRTSRSTWRVGGNSFVMGVEVKLSFRNGFVTELGSFTDALGDIAVNSHPFATYSLAKDIPHFVTVRLTYPGGKRDLERYQLYQE